MIRLWIACISSAALLGASVQGCGGVKISSAKPSIAEVPPVGQAGQWIPEKYSFRITDRNDPSRELPVDVWLPEKHMTESEPFPVSSPVLAFSHGSGGDIQFHQFTVEHLVSRGYAVALVGHIGNIGVSQFASSDTNIAVYRPQDVSQMIDLLEVENGSAGSLAGRMDLSRLAVGGHSFGGYTSLVLCGATIVAKPLLDRCAPDSEDGFSDIACRTGQQAALMNTLSDPRIDACVLYAPSVTRWFGEPSTGLSTIDRPVLMISGTQDTFTEYDGHVTAFAHMAAPTWFLTLEGGGHVGFTDVLNDGDMSHERMKSVVNLFTDAFLDLTLLGRTSAVEQLTPTWVETQAIDGDVSMQYKRNDSSLDGEDS